MISSKFDGALWLPRSLVTIGIQNKLNANFTALRTFYNDVLLLTTAYAVHFFLSQFPNMELMLLLPLFFTELLSFSRLVNVFDWLCVRDLTTWATRPSNSKTSIIPWYNSQDLNSYHDFLFTGTLHSNPTMHFEFNLPLWRNIRGYFTKSYANHKRVAHSVILIQWSFSEVCYFWATFMT